MAASSAAPFARRDLVVLPARRLLAIDAGSHTLKLVVVEEMFGRLRILSHELLELRSDTPAGEQEALRRAVAAIRELEDNPVALALPHYRALSLVIELPTADARDVRAAIEEESRKLSGLGESHIVHDYSRLGAFGRYENPFWVTLCQAAEVQRQIDRCGVGSLDLCEVTTTANALVAAFQAVHPGSGPAVLVDLGATGTVVAVVLGGQPVYTASFPLGGEVLAEALAARDSIPVREAEARLREPDTWLGGSAGALEVPLRRWLTELDRVVSEWLHDHGELKLEAVGLKYYLGGGAMELVGLREYLGRLERARFQSWPVGDDPEETPPARFAVAYGAALHALGRAPHPASLLPDEVRVYWNRHHSLQVLHSLLFFLCALLVLALGFGTWQKVDLLLDKRRMLEQTRTALTQAKLTEMMSRRLSADYEAIRPLLQRQLRTTQTLQSLALLQQARGSNSFWYVLFAGEPAYYLAPLPVSTNAPVSTNVLATPPVATPGRGFIAELCIPEQGEARRRILNQLVTDLRKSGAFRNVDSLPEDRRRPLADPAVVLTDSHSALLLELPEDPFGRGELATERRLAPAGGGVTEPRGDSARPTGSGGERRATPSSRGI